MFVPLGFAVVVLVVYALYKRFPVAVKSAMFRVG